MSIALKNMAEALSKLIQQTGTQVTVAVAQKEVSNSSTPTDSPSPNLNFTQQHYADVPPFSLEDIYSPEQIANLVGANKYQRETIIGLPTKPTATAR